MKKPKINLSKEGLSKFFLHHVEKVVLGAALLGMLFLLYNGWSTEKFTKTTPKKLSEEAASAKRYITSASSWESIEQFRSADLDADKRIADASHERLDPELYKVGAITGSPAASMSKRLDPELIAPEQLIARSFRAPVLVANRTANRVETELDKLVDAKSVARLVQRASEFEDDLDEYDDEEYEDRSPRRRRPVRRKPVEETTVLEPVAGTDLPDVMARELAGIRSGASGRGQRGAANLYLVDFVAVNGIVNFDAQFKKYEAAFRNAVGYYPRRDRPQYLYLEIQRKLVGTEDWEDISERLSIAESQYGAQSPEVIAPEYFHPVTVRPAPPLANVDIREIARHPKVPLRKLVPDSFAKRNEAEEGLDVEELFGGDIEIDDEDGMNDKLVGNGMSGLDESQYQLASLDLLRAPKANEKMIRFFDLTARAGSSYQYRVRLWLNDPNDPKGFGKDGQGIQGGGRFNGMDDGMMDDDGMDNIRFSGRGGQKMDSKEELENLDIYNFRMVSGSLQSREVRARMRDKEEKMVVPQFSVPNSDNGAIRQEQLNQILAHAWHTDWSEPTSPVTCGSSKADFYAGDISQPGVIKCNAFELPKEEKWAKVVTSVWSKKYNTTIPGLKAVRRGDVLNYTVDRAHLLDPSSGAVKVLANAEIVSDSMVVDLMGGESVEGGFNLPVNMPGEVLVLEADGSFRLQNSFDDLKSFRHSLLLEDEEQAFGEAPDGSLRGRDSGGFDEYDDEFDDDGYNG